MMMKWTCNEEWPVGIVIRRPLRMRDFSRRRMKEEMRKKQLVKLNWNSVPRYLSLLLPAFLQQQRLLGTLYVI